jgi:hypothetical protein
MRGMGAAAACCSWACRRASQVGLGPSGEASLKEGLSVRDVVSHL